VRELIRNITAYRRGEGRYAVQRKSYVPRAKSRVLRDLTQVDRRDGLPSPIVVNGLIEVWDRPGLGVDFKVEVAHEHLSEEDKHFFD
jgi:hypothetical protein